MGTETYIENPFTPTFGEIPPILAGRSIILNELSRAYGASRRRPCLTTAITGARGSGKTALMAAAADEACRRGWVVAKTVALPGMLDDILITARRESAHLVAETSTPRLSAVEIGQFVGLEWENPERLSNWRNEITLLLEQLERCGTGLLITVDEVQPTLPEMIQLASVYQLLVTEGRKVAMLFAGLPHNMLSLERDKRVSFLRRSQKMCLGRIADFEVREAMRKTVEEGGRQIEEEALDLAVEAAGGFPYMMQLVGFRMWDARDSCDPITTDDALEGVRIASAELLEGIVKVTYGGLSAGDKAFLSRMAKMEAPTSSKIAKAMGKSASYATQYKNRLLGQGVIEEGLDGVLRFQMPLLADYVAGLAQD